MSIEFDVISRFSSRPTLRGVAYEALKSELHTEFPSLFLDPDHVLVSAASSAQAGHVTLTDHFLHLFATGRTEVFDSTTLFEAANPMARIELDMQRLATLLDVLALGLVDRCAQALVNYWNAHETSAGLTRARWLSGQLRECLGDSMVGLALDTKSNAESVLSVIAAHPDRDARHDLGGDALGISACVLGYTTAGGQDVLMDVLVGYGVWAGEQVQVVWSPNGETKAYGSLHALYRSATDWLPKQDLQGAHWFLYEPDGDVFDTLAQVLLDCQLNALQRLKGRVFDSGDDAALYLAAATDVSVYLRSSLPPDEEKAVSEHIPQWLRQASALDRQAYGEGLQALAAVQYRAGGRAFNDGIAPIRQYAAERLQGLMLADHSQAEAGLATRVHLSIAKVVATPVPVGGSFSVVGDVDKVTLSLVDFALGNLASLPHGHVALVSDDHQPLPGWLTADYVTSLVTRADVGQHYPALIRRLLVDEADEAARRRALFRDQLREQLPLKALEQQIRGQGDMTREGYLLVLGLVDDSGPVLRPLAFESHPGAQPDRVIGMFVIGDAQTAQGPFLLYRPFAEVALRQFASWRALRDALVSPGTLCNEVLAWLPDSVRDIYANGGFEEPRIVRAGLGSEFAPIETPAPARLADVQVDGDVLDALFDATVHALVTLAERSSVSNAENRWATLQEGGWLLLNVLLPFVSGHASAAVWLAQLLDAVRALQPSATGAPEKPGLAPVLLTLGSALLHTGLGAAPLPRRSRLHDDGAPLEPEGEEGAEQQANEHNAQRPQRLPGQGHTLLDFSWSNPARGLSASQRERLRTFQVSAPAEALVRIVDGDRKGLLQAGERLYVRLDHALYRVRSSEDRIRIIGLTEPEQQGPWLIRGAHGAWEVDTALRLRGGMPPKKTLRQLAAENAANRLRLLDQLHPLGVRMETLRNRYVGYLEQLQTAKGEVRRLFMQRLQVDLADMVEVMRETLRLNEQFRSGDRLKETTVAKELLAVIRSVEACEALTLSDVLEEAKTHMSGGVWVGSELTLVNVGEYLDVFRQILAYQDTGVRWADERDALLKVLREVPKIGERMWSQCVLESDDANLHSALDWRIGRIWALLELSFEGERLLVPNEADVLSALRTDDVLHQAFRSHAELERPNDYTSDEQIGVLESALREYSRAVDVARVVLEVDIEGIDKERLRVFIQEVRTVAERAEASLSQWVRENVEPVKAPRQRVPKARRANKRVIRTRTHRTLVGRVRADSEGLPGEVVDVLDSNQTRVLASYHHHANGEWVEIVEPSPPRAEGTRPLVPLAELRRQAQRLLSRVDSEVATAHRQARHAQEPQDMEDILVQKADNLEALAVQLKRHQQDGTLDEADSESIGALVANLDTQIARLKAEGEQIRIEMIKAQPPTMARINYLNGLGKVHIASFNRRRNLSGTRNTDFLQEFAIRDADNLGQVLWWAHFHYASQDAPPGAYTAAHLKLPEQRKLGYSALVKMARDNKEVVQIYRSAIDRESAQRLFLSLTPGEPQAMQPAAS